MTTLGKNANYVRLIGASGATNLADGIASVAFPWLATLLTRDPFLIGLVAFAGRFPWLLLSVPAGVITDRSDRRSLIVRADVFRVLLTLGVVGLILTLPGNIEALPEFDMALPYVLALSGLSFLLGCAEVVRDNAAQTIMPSVVPLDDLERANGRLWTVETVIGRFVGPPLAGFLIAYALPAPFLLDAVAFGFAAFLVWCIALPPRIAPPKRSWRVETVEGLRWLWERPVLKRLALSLGAINGLASLAATILVLVAQERLGLSATGFGLLLTAGAAGGVAGGLLCPAIVARIGAQRSLTLSLGIIPLPFIGMMATEAFVVGIALFVETFVGTLWNVVTVSYRQRTIPDNLLGRVNSVYRFFGWGTISLGALLGGIVVGVGQQFFDRDAALQVPFVLAFVGTGALFLWGMRRLRIE
ncbi:MFS transporter [uncultured Tateyamaria sp.]|uniref:MFS transporter n=1 Tax=Tateyamaria sp. 1078 TaxID=3417464 RepID=UPI0026058BD2|nr:MFS transporter [uncultured Tateyamaria sp.]